MEFSTKVIHFNQPIDPATGSVVAPLYQTTTYRADQPG